MPVDVRSMRPGWDSYALALTSMATQAPVIVVQLYGTFDLFIAFHAVGVGVKTVWEARTRVVPSADPRGCPTQAA